MKTDFMVGPFEVRPKAGDVFDIHYGAKIILRDIYSAGTTRQAIIDDLSDVLADFRNTLHDRTQLDRIELVNPDGDVLDTILTDGAGLEGMVGSIPDNRYPYWATCGKMARPVTLPEWRRMGAELAAPARAWIANLLPEEVLSQDPETWRAPTSWELRHVVGEGSMTGISGARAAALIGISPANFRKYTASDGAANRQSISFAGWHLLLQRLKVTRPLTQIPSA